MKIITAFTDFSDRSARALERASAIAAATGADLLIVHAVDDSLPTQILEHRIGEAEDALRAQSAALTAANLRWEVVTGDIFWVLHDAAMTAHADLIVVGDHRRSPLRDLFRDTTVERMIRIAAVPVLVARRPAAPSYRHALAGVESTEGRELIEVLADLGPAAPARVTVLHAVSAPAEGLLYYAGAKREVREDYRAQIERETRSQLAASLENSPLPVDIVLADPPPAAAIIEAARTEGCDLVAVSSHARRGLARGLLGSVSSELLRHGTTDLLIVPRIVTERQLP